MSREWTVVIKGDWYLPHFVNMLQEYRGNGEQVSCATEIIDQIKSQMIPLEGDETLKTTRPLVVIDPDDREAVERLWRHTGDGGIDDLQYALREYANPKPPKPEEPQGLGAVVEDERGDAWVLINVAGEEIKPVRQWRTWWGNRPWTDIAAVRVLSPGVEVDQ